MNLNHRLGTSTPHRVASPMGFSMPEVLIAMAIFAIGFTAVASIFPVAILLQKGATEDTLVQIATDNAVAMINARTFEHDALPDEGIELDIYMPTDTKVHPVTVKAMDVWTYPDRTYPKSVIDPINRDVYWELLARRTKYPDTTPEDWQFFVFVMRQDEQTNNYFWPESTFSTVKWAVAHNPTPDDIDNWELEDSVGVYYRKHPNVVGVPATGSGSRFSFNNRVWSGFTPAGEPDQVRIGDQILDSNGTTYQVIEADATGVEVDGFILSSPAPPDTIWYGAPSFANKQNPVKRILIISGVVR